MFCIQYKHSYQAYYTHVMCYRHVAGGGWIRFW